MLRHKNIDRVCCIVLALTVLLSMVFVGAAASGLITEDATIGYEDRLFDQSRMHTIDIVMDDWEAFLDTATSEEYSACHLVIDGESYKNVAIRGKGNTSLSSVDSYGNDRYSFKVEFDHYQSGSTYHGLDKLSLNNLIYDNTYMKDYFAYTLMNKMGAAAPLCSFVQVNVNGEPWGLYLAVEGVEDAFLQRSYGKDHGELYKPDSLSFGGGRGNGGDFDMDKVMEDFDLAFPSEDGELQTDPVFDMGGMQLPDGFDPAQWRGFGSAEDESADAPAMPAGGMSPDMSEMPADGDISDKSGASTMAESFSRMKQNARMGGGMGMGSDDVKLQYIDDDPSSYANIFNSAKTDVTEADQARLIAALKALGEGDVSAVDTEAVIRYMAVHNFLCNDDSYTGMMVHNYYLYEEDGVLEMIPWDYNLAYGTMSSSDAASAVNTDIDVLVSNGGGDRPMADWITASEEYMAQYHAVYQEFMITVFDSGWFTEEIDRVTALISPYVEGDPTAFCTYAEFLTAAETLKAFCLKRAESVSGQLSGSAAMVDASGIDLSAMGSMNNGMGGRVGGFARSSEGFDRSSRTDGEDAFAAAAEIGKRSRSAVSERGQTGEASAIPSQEMSADRAAASSKETAEKGPGRSADSAEPSEGQAADAVGAGWAEQSHSGLDTAGMTRQSGASDSWIYLAVCAVLLCAALLFVKCWRTNR